MKLAAFLLAFLTLFGPTAEGISGDKTIFLVRHAEKCTEPAGDPDLTEYGRQRAQDLTRVLMDVELDAIYSTPFKRTLNTARPLAQMHGVKIIETPAESGFMEAMVSRIKAGEAHNILISGHSNTTPVVVNLLAGTTYENLDESEYDRLFIVVLHNDGAASVSILRYGAPSGPSEAC